MKRYGHGIRLSATDLSNHLMCLRLTRLDYEVAFDERGAPDWVAPDALIMQQRGIEHEAAYLESLRASGIEVLDLRDIQDETNALRETRAAMDRGVQAIAQAALADGQWFGKADILRRVQRESRIGPWSYEVYDCKLARETKAASILQLSLYCELLENAQGMLPEQMYVVRPGEGFEIEPYRVLDYAAYYRYVKSKLAKTIQDDNGGEGTYPEPTAHCDMCKWRGECDGVRRRDDHLSLVAGITRLQRKQLTIWETRTVTALSRFPLPITRRPDYGSKEGYTRVREQARLQMAGRTQQRPVYEVLEITDNHGLCLLPEPSEGDVSFDLEGDPFVGLTGREYLFGLVMAAAEGPRYEARWALTPADEKRAFEWFVDTIMARWARDHRMHIYHFAPYEPAAVKRLMGRYGTREDEIDRMLRAGLFIDLHTVLKRSLRASVEQYSLKALESFHGYVRALPLDDAGAAMRQMQHGLELGRASEVGQPVRDAIETYNRDDCLSTLSLRDWLERERAAVERGGRQLPRPVPGDGAPAENVGERQLRAAALTARLRAGIPEDSEQRDGGQAATWLLSDLVDWHRREAKADWWEYFRLRDLADEDLLDERAALAGLSFIETIDVTRKIPTDRYSFERQDTNIRAGDKISEHGDVIGTVVAIDLSQRTVDIKKTRKTAERHPISVFVDGRGPTDDVLAESLFRLGDWAAANSMDAPGPYRAARDLLLKRNPRLRGAAGPLIEAGETVLQAAIRTVGLLDHSVLAIQGPPGAGKTFTGARMICRLVRDGRRVGITAMSHKVIRNLLNEVLDAAPEFGLNGLTCMQKVSETEEEDPPGIVLTTDNGEPLQALAQGTRVVAGTAWLWSRPEYFEAVDVLFVDEAGQMSLANVLAVSQAARSIVLLGDPQQLEQPLKGSHPDGADASALEHILAGEKTIGDDKGLFLPETWRMHPVLCSFTSEVFYENRLNSHRGLEQRRIEGHPWLGEFGLWFVPVSHAGNQNSSPEEVERIAGIVESLIQPGVARYGKDGLKPMSLGDVLIVAPYNAQISDLGARMPGARIGTVDKFQGQEAAVVIYSLTTSSPEDAPRGMEFLYSLNRFNVATSRAQAMVIVVGSPRLLEPECRNPRQMQLANALCRYVELASIGERLAAAGG